MSFARGVLLASALCVAVLLGSAPAAAKESKRYGIRGELVDYDETRSVFRILVKDDEAKSFGGSTAGGKAPKDIVVGEEMDFSVKPEGSVLSRTVIKSTQGNGLDNSGTAEGFRNAVQAIPRDRAVVLSIEKNGSAGPEMPAYRIQTVFIPLTDEEIARRLREFTEGED